jgi:hypothetical protein
MTNQQHDPIQDLRAELNGKTREDIETLKKNWLADPCFEIEDTKGFEAHREELIAWRKDHEWKDNIARKVHADMRYEHIMNETGVTDREIALALSSFEEISIRSHQGYAERKPDLIAYQQVKATLLQAAQLKRIADALETIAEGDTTITTLSSSELEKLADLSNQIISEQGA